MKSNGLRENICIGILGFQIVGTARRVVSRKNSAGLALNYLNACHAWNR